MENIISFIYCVNNESIFRNSLQFLTQLKVPNGYEIEVEVEEINYKDTCFSRAAHRLALAEIQEIVKYQKMGQCLLQTPEGVGEYEEKFWEKNCKE